MKNAPIIQFTHNCGVGIVEDVELGRHFEWISPVKQTLPVFKNLGSLFKSIQSCGVGVKVKSFNLYERLGIRAPECFTNMLNRVER